VFCVEIKKERNTVNNKFFSSVKYYFFNFQGYGGDSYFQRFYRVSCGLDNCKNVEMFIYLSVLFFINNIDKYYYLWLFFCCREFGNF